MTRVGSRFRRVEPRRRARAFALGLLAELPRVNCWTVAEHAGDSSPDGMQHLLARAKWDADGVHDDVRGYVLEHLGDPGAVLVVGETGDLKKGTATAGVQRQYTGTAGRIENAQVAVYLGYSAPAGHALIDRELYLPKSWTCDPERCAAAGIPENTAFATKPQQWTAHVREQWAARRAFASESGSEGGAWLEGDAAEAIACDAAMAPIVTGDVNIDALEDLVRLCVELDAQRRDGTRDAAWAALEQAVIGSAVDLLSGPGGLASFLRRRQLGARLGGPSLPLDIGYSETIPPGIRNAVVLRDHRCRWAGGCNQPASACEVHHTRHKANGGPTSTADCVLLCTFHHQIAIHRWGWNLVLNPDGTTTAWNKDKTKVLHSHGPPARAG